MSVRSERQPKVDPDSSRLGRERYRKKLNELLGMAVDEEFFQLVWGIDALQTERADAARRYIVVPPEVGEPKIGDAHYVGAWDIETLLNELLYLPKVHARKGRFAKLDCRQFAAIIRPVQNLRRLENAESGVVLRRLNILSELPRIAYRQFHWQRGYMNQPQFYRWHYLFSGDRCRNYFSAKYGLSIPDFALAGFALFGHFAKVPWLVGPLEIPEIALTRGMVECALRMMAITHEDAQRQARKLHDKAYGTAYQPSLFRRTPLVRFEDRLRAPIIELILSRITGGIYYDLVDGPSDLRNEIAERFESYAFNFASEFLNSSAVERSYKYRQGSTQFDTPDVLVRRGGSVAVAFECKAKKMTFEACFSEVPLQDAEMGFDELAKGVFQLWRFFSHVRRGVLRAETCSREAVGVVLTLDNWLTASLSYPSAVLEKARRLAEEKDPGIIPDDMRPILFCPVEDLEGTLCHGTETSFFDALAAATGDRFAGWSLPNVQRELTGESGNKYPLHGRLGELLPWWAALEQRKAKLGLE